MLLTAFLVVKVSGTFVPELSSLPSLCDICLQETFALELLKLRAQVSKQTNISAQVLFSEGPVAIFEVVGLILAKNCLCGT